MITPLQTRADGDLDLGWVSETAQQQSNAFANRGAAIVNVAPAG